MRTLILTPTYNEIDNIERHVDAVLAVTPASVGEVGLLVIDDGSPDGTGKIADQKAAANSRVKVLHRTQKQGLGPAYIAGYAWGLANGYDAFIEMDADGSHDPKYLPTMLSELAKSDMVIGSRYVPGGGTVNWGLGRKIISRFGGMYARLILGAPIRDFTAGFIGVRKKVIDAVNLSSLRSDGYSFQIELKYRTFLKGFSIREFPIVFEDRKVGKSKMSRKIVLEALARVIQFRFRQPRVS